MMSADARRDSSCDVAIVGAGPSGLVAAIRLAELGCQVSIIDAAPAPATESRAVLIHAATIEILDHLGLGSEMLERGRRIDAITIADGSRVLARIPFHGLDSRFPFALGLPQSTTEALLIDRLHELGVTVDRGCRATSVTQDTKGCVLTVIDEGTRDTWTKRCHYVIGADGKNSTIRDLTGLVFSGGRYGDDFVLADVNLAPHPTPPDEARVFLSPHGVTVLGMFPSGRYRIVATSLRGQDTPRAPGRTYLDELLSMRDIGARTDEEPVWSSRFRITHQVADRFRAGRVFLCGDAAHVHSPAAGQGMNTGISDAYDLANRLVAACHGDLSTLDGYDATRRPVALEVVRLTDRVTTVALTRSALIRRLRNTVLRTASRIPWVRRRIVSWVSGIKRSPLPRAHEDQHLASSRSRRSTHRQPSS